MEDERMKRLGLQHQIKGTIGKNKMKDLIKRKNEMEYHVVLNNFYILKIWKKKNGLHIMKRS